MITRLCSEAYYTTDTAARFPGRLFENGNGDSFGGLFDFGNLPSEMGTRTETGPGAGYGYEYGPGGDGFGFEQLDENDEGGVDFSEWVNFNFTPQS